MTSGGTAGPAGRGPAPAARPKFTSRAAVLAIVLCAIALSLAYPVREYIAERRQIDQLVAQNAQLAIAVRKDRAEQRALASNSYVEQQARDKLHMCFPDQTCYVVITPAEAARPDHRDAVQFALVRTTMGFGSGGGPAPREMSTAR